MKRRGTWFRLVGFAAVIGLPLAAVRPLGLIRPRESLLDPLALDGFHRVLVLAPHCDDEVLGAGGLILAARRSGAQVRVVVATNGDGFYFATARDSGHLRQRPQDYVHLGNERQLESIAAVGMLGVPRQNVDFLGYPDRGLAVLWNEHWSNSRPFRSKYTRAVRSPYARTYHPKSTYSGEDLLRDLRSILRQYRPDLVIYSHPNDDHPDHWALSNFTRLALEEEEQSLGDWHPAAWAYLIHRCGWPADRGWHPDRPLIPPAPLFDVTNRWAYVALRPTDPTLKRQALARYPSQAVFLRKLFAGLTRRNELFCQFEPAPLPQIATGEVLHPESWQDESGQPVGPVVRDPERDSRSREAFGGADFRALYVARRPDGAYLVAAETRRRLKRAFRYVVQVKAVQPDGAMRQVVLHWPDDRQPGRPVEASGSVVGRLVHRGELGKPTLLLVGAASFALPGRAENVQLDVIDHTAWQLLRVPPWPATPAALPWSPPALAITPVRPAP